MILVVANAVVRALDATLRLHRSARSFQTLGLVSQAFGLKRTAHSCREPRLLFGVHCCVVQPLIYEYTQCHICCPFI